MAGRDFRSLLRRLNRAGFDRTFVSKVLLPEWWHEGCSDGADLVPELEVRIARFLDVPISTVTDPNSDLAPRPYPAAQLRRVRDIDRDRLAPAIHAAHQIAAATVRNLGPSTPSASLPPESGSRWRDQIDPSTGQETLEAVLDDLWRVRGIPVIPIGILPSPSFQGLAAIVGDRPVIVVGHNHDEPGRIAFRVAHEAGHVAAGDCTPNAPIVDQDEEISVSSDPMEQQADRYATEVIVGKTQIPTIRPDASGDFKVLAKLAAKHERDLGVDAGAILSAWARTTGDYGVATLAMQALYRTTGGQRTLRQYFTEFVATSTAPESDRELFRSVVLSPSEHGAPSG